jgi:hypothetical protein
VADIGHGILRRILPRPSFSSPRHHHDRRIIIIIIKIKILILRVIGEVRASHPHRRRRLPKEQGMKNNNETVKQEDIHIHEETTGTTALPRTITPQAKTTTPTTTPTTTRTSIFDVGHHKASATTTKPVTPANNNRLTSTETTTTTTLQLLLILSVSECRSGRKEKKPIRK